MQISDIFESETFEEFCPEVIDRYREYNPDYEPAANVNP